MFYWFISDIGFNQRNFISSGNESSSPIILQEPIIQENLYCKSGLSSQTCWAQCGHLGPRNAKYWSPLISAKRISILITCDSEMPKKRRIKRMMYYAQPNQTAVMLWHHLATSLKTSQPLPKTNFQWATSTSYIGLAKSLWKKLTKWWGGYCW